MVVSLHMEVHLSPLKNKLESERKNNNNAFLHLGIEQSRPVKLELHSHISMRKNCKLTTNLKTLLITKNTYLNALLFCLTHIFHYLNMGWDK
jgi:hypothetical protein